MTQSPLQLTFEVGMMATVSAFVLVTLASMASGLVALNLVVVAAVATVYFKRRASRKSLMGQPYDAI